MEEFQNKSAKSAGDYKYISDFCEAEVGSLESKSSINNTDVKSLINLDDKKLFREIEKCCPVLVAALKGAVGEKKAHLIGPLLTVVGILYKSRYSGSRACVITHRMDQLLVAAGAKKKVFKWLNCFAVTNSYSTANRKHKQMAKNHDEKVLKWKKEIEDACKQIIQEKPGITKEELIAELKTRKVLEFQLVADNLDISQHSRHQDKENKNDSKHWFHTMAVLERVHSSQDLRTADYYKQMDVLPGPKTQKALFDDYTILFGRIIVKYLPAFDIFKKCFPKHIEHAFTKEMSKKSEVESLGLLFKCETKTAEMIQILENLQENYVPKSEKDEKDLCDTFVDIPFGGDQLTEERAVNSQKARLDGENDLEKLKGLSPKFEDWHAKKCLYEVKDGVFRDKGSGNEAGTTAWALNFLHKTNAKPGPDKAFNHYKDFTDVELDAQVTSCAMKYFNMTKIEDNPIPADISISSSGDVKSEWIYDQVRCIIRRFTVTYTSQYNGNKDCIQSYHKALLTYNIMLRNINDSIREGDGERLLNCYKYALLFYKCFGRNKYSYTILKMIYRMKLQPSHAFRLIWGRFINTTGIKGRNISLDLHLEHLNHFLKELLGSLRGNLSEKNADRKSKAVNNTKYLIENIEKNYGIASIYRSARRGDFSKDVIRLAVEYDNINIWGNIPKRSYESYPEFQENLLNKMDKGNFVSWLAKKKREFEALYN